jgi:hypothetical protein
MTAQNVERIKKKQKEHIVTTKTLSNTVGERINEFDSWQTQIVGNFNALFPECPLKGFDVEDPVLIGDPASNNSRELLVDGVYVVHKMYSDLLYGLDKGEYNMLEDKEETDIMGYPV